METIFTVVRRQYLQQVLTLVSETLPDAFYSIEEVTSARETVYPIRSKRDPFHPLRLFFKSK